MLGAMSSLFFGATRPLTVVSARIEIKVPVAPSKPSLGRPFKVWSGMSDADEAQVYTLISDSKILNKLLNDRKLLSDGSCALEAILHFIDGNQIVLRHEFTFDYFALNLDGSSESITAFTQKVLEVYAQQLSDIRENHREMMKAQSDTFGRMAEAFSSGLGKVSKHNKGLNRIARKLETDRAKLTEALLKLSSERGATAQASGSPSKLMTGIEAIKLLTSLKDKPGSSSGNAGSDV